MHTTKQSTFYHDGDRVNNNTYTNYSRLHIDYAYSPVMNINEASWHYFQLP